jgi:hypothetical protein
MIQDTKVSYGEFELKKVGEWSFFQLPGLGEKGITHGFCTGDSPSDLLNKKTRQHFLNTFLLNDVVVMNQEHGDHVHVIGGGEGRPLSGDGLIILEKGVAGIIKTADCLPVIICDPHNVLVSIVHAGWRGTAKKIVMKAAQAMESLGSKREDMVALLGPSIGSCCYEVKNDVHEIFRSEGFPHNIFRTQNNSLYLDLKKANGWMLRSGGIDMVYECPMCTFCNNRLFHSFRRGDAGKRQINFVYFKG